MCTRDRVALALVLTASLAACGGGNTTPGTTCTTTLDCPDGEICVGGQCRAAGDGPAETDVFVPVDGWPDGATGDGASMDVPPTDGASPDGTSADGTPGDGTSGDGTPADGTSGDGTPADGETGDTIPADTPPESFWVDDDGDTFAEGTGDCDDGDPRIRPGATEHIEGIDYDCDGKREFLATFLITVDDWYERLCVNDIDVPIDPATSRDWFRAETYTVVMESGLNAVGVHGVDLYEVISAFMMRIEVAGRTYLTTGVSPGEPDTTPWRYSPDPDEDPQANWCMPTYDDSAWGPARYVAEWGSSPWGPSPPEFSGVGADWIWDDRPTWLQDAWFRIEIELPY